MIGKYDDGTLNDYISDNKICSHELNYSFSEEEISFICNKENSELFASPKDDDEDK